MHHAYPNSDTALCPISDHVVSPASFPLLEALANMLLLTWMGEGFATTLRVLAMLLGELKMVLVCIVNL